jgi:DNA-binding winged helix-turn-helix (wHTH) protein
MPTSAKYRRFRFGAFIADLNSFELFKHGIRVRLQHQPFQILKVLLESGGDVVTRDELRLELWAESTFVDFDAGLNAAVRRLRDSLNDSAEEPRYIETLALRVERPETLIPLPVPNVEPPREYHVFITLVSPDPE